MYSKADGQCIAKNKKASLMNFLLVFYYQKALCEKQKNWNKGECSSLKQSIINSIWLFYVCMCNLQFCRDHQFQSQENCIFVCLYYSTSLQIVWLFFCSMSKFSGQSAGNRVKSAVDEWKRMMWIVQGSRTRVEAKYLMNLKFILVIFSMI